MSAIPAPPVPPFPLGPTFGAFYMSALVCVGFWGITCMQTFLYFIHYQQDRRALKYLVISLWVLDTTHIILIVRGVYFSLIDQFGNFASIAIVVPELVLEFLFSGIVGVTTQGFFVYRIYIFSDKKLWLIPLLWVPAGIFQMVSCIIYVSKGVDASSVTVLTSPLLKGLSIGHLAVAAGVDVIIALCLTILLAKRKATAGFKSSAKMLQRLAIFSINSGAWTAVFALASIILFVVFPTNVAYVAFDFPICAIYCNTLLANLNARAYINGKIGYIGTDTGFRSAEVHSMVRVTESDVSGSTKNAAAIRIDQTTNTLYSYDKSKVVVTDSYQSSFPSPNDTGV